MHNVAIGARQDAFKRGHGVDGTHQVGALSLQSPQTLASKGFVVPQAPLDQAHRPARGVKLCRKRVFEAAGRAIAGLSDIAGKRRIGADRGKYREEIECLVRRGGGQLHQAGGLRTQGGGERGLLGSFQARKQRIDNRVDHAMQGTKTCPCRRDDRCQYARFRDVDLAILDVTPEAPQFGQELQSVGGCGRTANQDEICGVGGRQVAGNLSSYAAHSSDQ